MITGFTGSSRESSKWLSCDLMTSFVQSSTDNCHIELFKTKDVRRNFIFHLHSVGKYIADTVPKVFYVKSQYISRQHT